MTMAATKEDAEQILEDAFSQAFSPQSSHHQLAILAAQAQSTDDTTKASAHTPTAVEEAVATAVSEPAPAFGEEETWKQEYEEQVKAWRVQSAEAREKAERIREQWETKRAAEREEAAQRKATGIPEPESEVIPGPPNKLASVSSSAVLVPSETAREDIAHEKQTGAKTEGSTVLVSSSPGEASVEPQPHVAESTISQPDTVDDSQKWEEINSSTSSYPSMSFPEQTTPPLQHREPQHHHSHHEPAPVPPTATLSVFDSSLSTRTRLKALASSLAINLFLPFVNGVMLGFGEIFAKNYALRWLGWGSTATAVGIPQRSRFGTRR